MSPANTSMFNGVSVKWGKKSFHFVPTNEKHPYLESLLLDFVKVVKGI